MKTMGIFEAKTKLSQICQDVASTHTPVLITRRGSPLVRIEPADIGAETIKERRARYMAGPGKKEKQDKDDFEPAPRSEEISEFDIEG